LLVPQVGVTHDPAGHATALVVGPDNKVEQRTIQATATSGANWVVDGGLKDGERVIVSGMQKVQPGMSVRTVDAQIPAGLGAQKSAAADTASGPGTPRAPPPVTR
jgi:membrane fusion protein (multidrug efflux system)